VNPFLIVGLGNPGRSYLKTRHNIGFMVADHLASQSSSSFEKGFKSEVAKIKIHDQAGFLIKPQTFMNLSGEAVQYFVQFYKVPLEKLVVIQDDLDQKFGSLKWQKKRGHGGHNGIRSIHQLLGTDEYVRLKFGVGKPSHLDRAIADWVLSPFSPEEERLLPELIKVSVESLKSWIAVGFDKTASIYNKNWAERLAENK
jgi:PTH1 family peptidyl-tRNA hydrolase